ncbi:putative DNA-directed DNA polymerase [Helianthus debilis subsp. tardiflorus]
MLDAFEAGGDFHSGTAMNMYPYICDAIDSKHVLLEWHTQPGQETPSVPFLKVTKTEAEWGTWRTFITLTTWRLISLLEKEKGEEI